MTLPNGDAILLKIARCPTRPCLRGSVITTGVQPAQFRPRRGRHHRHASDGTYVNVTDGNTFQDKTGSYVLRPSDWRTVIGMSGL